MNTNQAALALPARPRRGFARVRALTFWSLLFGYAATRGGEWQCWLLTHGPQGSRVQQVSLNRLQSAGGRPPMDPEFDVATVLYEHLRR